MVSLKLVMMKCLTWVVLPVGNVDNASQPSGKK